MIILAYQANGLSYILKKYRIIRIRIHIHRIFKNPYHILVSDIFGVDWISVFTLVKTISVFAEKATEEENRMAGEDFPPALIFIALSLSREREKKTEKEEEKTFSTSRRPYTLGIASRARHVGAPHSPCSACVGPFPGRFCNLPAPSWRRARPHLSPAFSLIFPSYNIHFASREIEIAWVDLG